MKRAYLIHGWGGKPERAFRPWLKKQLEAQGYEVTMPAMPDTDRPTVGKWVAHLQSVIQDPDEETLLVGHSLGGPAILRYLETLPEGVRVGKTIMVAPVVDTVTGLKPEEEVFAKPWFELPKDIEKIKRAAGTMIGFFSDNDHWIPVESEQIFKNRYHAITYREHGMGHYNEESNVIEVPTVLKAILE